MGVVTILAGPFRRMDTLEVFWACLVEGFKRTDAKDQALFYALHPDAGIGVTAADFSNIERGSAPTGLYCGPNLRLKMGVCAVPQTAFKNVSTTSNSSAHHAAELLQDRSLFLENPLVQSALSWHGILFQLHYSRQISLTVALHGQAMGYVKAFRPGFDPKKTVGIPMATPHSVRMLVPPGIFPPDLSSTHELSFAIAPNMRIPPAIPLFFEEAQGEDVHVYIPKVGLIHCNAVVGVELPHDPDAFGQIKKIHRASKEVTVAWKFLGAFIFERLAPEQQHLRPVLQQVFRTTMDGCETPVTFRVPYSKIRFKAVPFGAEEFTQEIAANVELLQQPTWIRVTSQFLQPPRNYEPSSPKNVICISCG